MCVRTLIPAVVTEYQLLTSESSGSNGSRQVLALFFFGYFFFWARKRIKPLSVMQGGAKCHIVKSDNTTIKSNLKQSCKLATSRYCHWFNLSSLSRQRRNLEGKKRGASFLLYVSILSLKMNQYLICESQCANWSSSFFMRQNINSGSSDNTTIKFNSKSRT